MTLAIPLSRPRWVAGVVWGLITLASAALAYSGHWLGLSVGWVVLLGATPVAVMAGTAACNGSPTGGTLIIRVKPGGLWRLHFVESEVTGRKATLVQTWHHIFGLTLAFNLRNDPHNKPECIKLTVWRRNVSPDTYRRLCVLSAWQTQQSEKVFPRESV